MPENKVTRSRAFGVASGFVFPSCANLARSRGFLVEILTGFSNERTAEARAQSEARSTGRKMRVVARDGSDLWGRDCTWEVWPYDVHPDGNKTHTWYVVNP